MKIEQCNSFYGQSNHTAPSFRSIHPTRFYLKGEDGAYRQITNFNTIKNRLQRKIVTLLNRDLNDGKRRIKGRAPKKETPEERNLRERIMRFFIANDRDYATRKEVASVYLDKNRSYMLTGNTVDRIGDGKPIGKAYGQIRETQDYMRNYYGYSNEEARHYVSPADKLKLDMAKEAYFKETETAVQNLIANPRVNKSYLDFYFEPIVGKKSHKLKGFNLIDVAFKNFLSSFQ